MIKSSAAQEFADETAIALSSDHLAERILESARNNRVNLRNDPLMVNALAHFNITDSIPPELYRTVSEILTFLQQLESSVKP